MKFLCPSQWAGPGRVRPKDVISTSNLDVRTTSEGRHFLYVQKTCYSRRYYDVFYSSFLVGLLKRRQNDVLFVRVLDVPFRTQFGRFPQVLF